MTDSTSGGLTGGIIGVFARHPVAGNLLMLLLLIFGAWGLTQLNRQILPDFELDLISISVRWPGASPEDVEMNVIAAIEPEVRFLDSIDRVDAVAYEGRAAITIRFEDGANMSRALTDVQAAIARITTFPSDIERPVITQVTETDEVCRIEISGPYSEQALKLVGKEMRDDLLDLGMSKITLAGARDSEIWVEIPPATLRQLDLTLSDIADRIEHFSLDLPSGSIDSGGLSRQIRSEALARTAREVGQIEVISEASGQKLRIKDIGRILETFEASAVSHVRNGRPSIGLIVRRGSGVDSIEAQQILLAYIDRIQAESPPSLNIDIFDVFADVATQRVRMLVNNGFSGLAIVLIVLFIFLNVRVAFWVAMGIPIAIMGAFGGMALLGMSLNMISMFAVIMGLGIIVDDAIVIGEHTEMLHRHGMSPEEATMTTTKVMFAPVLAASLTTIAAFFPILTIGNEIGRIVRELPLTIILVIIASLAECFLVLPMHLRKALEKIDRKKIPKEPRGFNRLFVRFRDTKFSNAVTYCFDRRYSTVLAACCAFLIALTLLLSGRVGFEFFASPEVDMVFGNFSLTPGASRTKSQEMIDELQRAALEVEQRLTNGDGGLINYEFGSIGSTEGRQGEGLLTGDHAGAYTIELISSDYRSVRTYEFMAAWEQAIRPIAGIESFIIFERSAGGPPGRDIDIRLHGAGLDVLKSAAMEIRRQLASIPGVTAIEDNLPHGKQEIVMEVTPKGLAIGFTTQSVARQVRNSFEGAIAKRFSQDQEEIIVRVKLTDGDRQGARSLHELYLRAPGGEEVPLTEVVSLSTSVGYAQIRRENGLRQLSVTADVDPMITTTNEVLGIVDRDIAPDMRKKYGINIEFKGKAEEQSKAIGDTFVALLIAVMTMYIILAWVFSSYSTPMVVMSIVPFGLIGAFFGHWIMDERLNMLSLQALLGLSGVIINDAIIIVSSIKRHIGAGLELREAVIIGARERLRPVILTTLTTIGCLTPLLFERSMQAQLVQPLAVTLIFGLLFSPLLILFFVPSLLGIGTDIRRLSRKSVPVTVTG
jgi:multidrug efflux pump subunit AcrB